MRLTASILALSVSILHQINTSVNSFRRYYYVFISVQFLGIITILKKYPSIFYHSYFLGKISNNKWSTIKSFFTFTLHCTKAGVLFRSNTLMCESETAGVEHYLHEIKNQTKKNLSMIGSSGTFSLNFNVHYTYAAFPH